MMKSDSDLRLNQNEADLIIRRIEADFENEEELGRFENKADFVRFCVSGKASQIQAHEADRLRQVLRMRQI